MNPRAPRPPAPEPIEVPARLGPYRTGARLGRGGMGVVVRGEPDDGGPAVAIKTVRLPSGRHLDAIRREIRALASVEHPGVVRILEDGVHSGGLPWYAMELLQGVTLRETRFSASATRSGSPRAGSADDAPAPAPRGPVTEAELPEVLTLFRRLCEPLAFVHGEGLVHCDLKPENIVLCDDGRVVLVDFGLNSRFGSGEVLDLELFVGTADYMAPEQWVGKPVDARTDLYALGCMLFEALTGQPPFRGPRKALRAEHLERPPPLVRALAPIVPAKLETLVGALLSKQPSLRPGHADEVAAVLEACGAATAEPAAVPRPIPRPYLFRPALAGRGRTTHELVQRISGAPEAQVILLGGEPGVGKTRLALETARMARRGGLQLLTGQAAPNAPLLAPVRGLVTKLWERCHGDPDAAAALLGPHGPVLARLEPGLGTLAVLADAAAPPPLDPEGERARRLAALDHALERQREAGRLVWLIDDVHWADPATIDFLEHVLNRREDFSGVAIIGTYRPSEPSLDLDRLLKHPAVETLTIGRLPPRAVSRIVADMLGVEPPEGFVQALTGQSEGNPYFVAEFLRAAVASGKLLRGADGRWRLAQPDLAALDLPRSLSEVLTHRLDHLGPPARAFVDAASVVGRDVWPDLAARLAGLEGPDADAALTELLRKQVLEEASQGGLRFSHDRIREIAYAALPEATRPDRHRAAARALERRQPTDPRVSHAALAHHWGEAGEPAKAILHLERAADEALASGAYEDANRALVRALDLSDAASPPVALDPLKRAGWHRRLGETHLAAGRLAESRTASETALDLLHVRRPRTQGAWVRALIGQFLRQALHRLAPEGMFVDDAQRAALVEATRASGHLARVAFFENDPLRLIASSLWSINLAERAGHFVHAARNYSGLGWTFGLTRIHGLADAYFARARRVGEESRDWAGLIFCLTSEALYRIGRGEFERAEAALLECKPTCDLVQDPQGREVVDTLLGHPAYFRGRFEEAIAIHRRVERAARTRRNQQHEAWSQYCVARSQLALGRLDDAKANLHAARDKLQGLTDQMSDITCTGLLASAYLRGGEPERAAELRDETVAHIGAAPPTVFLTQHGYEAVAEVALWARARDDGREARRRAAKATKKLIANAGVFGVCAPRAWLLEGRRRRLDGDDRGAGRAWLRALSAAERLDLPYERACAMRALGGLGGDEASGYALDADRAFDALGCPRDPEPGLH